MESFPWIKCGSRVRKNADLELSYILPKYIGREGKETSLEKAA
jgi:hypothetical protein